MWRSKKIWLAAVVVTIVFGITAYWLVRRAHGQDSATQNKIVLAVLPFENLTGDPAQEFVSDGFTEEMITQLSHLPHDRLGVIARTSAMAFKGKTDSIADIGKQLGANYILEGSVRKWQGRVRVTAQLIRTADQTHVWAENYESDRGDILRLQSDITEDIAQQIKLRLEPNEFRGTPPVVDPQAHELYLKGRHYLALRSHDDLQSSVSSFQQAIAKDPNYAAAYAGLADAYNLIGFYGFDPDLNVVAQAKAAAQKALQLDDSLAAGHAALAYNEFMWRGDWTKAEAEFRRALELDDNYVPAHQWYALYLAGVGNTDEALSQMRFAQKLDPLSASAHTSLGYMYYFADQYDEAIQQEKLALQLAPNSMVAHAVLGWSYTEQKDYSHAIDELRLAIQLSGGVPVYECALARALALSGNSAGAANIISRIEVRAGQPLGIGTPLAAAYLAMGNSDRALQWLEATAPGDTQANWLRVDPAFDSLRTNARFKAVVDRVGRPE
jgi:TolB-like protein/tetratricopeptide (TPR) repeat protein